MGFLYDPTWYAIDSPRGLADQATAMLQTLEAGQRDEVKLAEIVRRASDAYASRFPDDVDRMAPSVSESVMRDRPKLATLECRFCRKVLEEIRRPRANGFSIDWVAWDVESGAGHGETCALGVLAGSVKPVGVAKTVVRSRAALAKLPMRFELDNWHGDVDHDVKVTIFGEGFTSRRVEVWFGDHRAKILKRVSDRERLGPAVRRHRLGSGPGRHCRQDDRALAAVPLCKADVLSGEVPYRRRMRWILILLVLAACPRKLESDEERKEGYVKQMEPILAAHKAPATAKLEAMRAVMKMLAAAPHVDQREALGPGVACTLDTCERTSPGDDPTARWKGIENILRTGYDENTAAPSVEDSLRKLEAIKYFVVIRTHSYDPPVPGDQPDRYVGGHAAGDVAIYDLATRTRVGGFPWEVGAPDVASIDPKADRKSELDRAMRGSIALKIDDAIEAYLAGKAAAPPPSAPADDGDLRERQIKELLINKQMIVDSVEIVEKPSCRVVLRTFITTGIALHPPEGFGEGDGIVQPAATELVNKVLGKECAVSYQLAK